MVATAWVSTANTANATELVGTDVINVASITYNNGSVTGRLLTNEAIFTIPPPAPPAVIEFFRTSSTATSPIMRNINGTDFSPTGDLSGAFVDIGPPVTAGGGNVKLTDEVPLIPATTYLAGELIFVRVTDFGQNLNSDEIETVEISLEADSGDIIVLRLYESDPDSGEFFAYVPSSALASDLNDGTITVSENTQLTATYIDTFNQTDVTIDTAIVNPLNRVFSSVTGEPVDGAIITVSYTHLTLPTKA